jgi:hypothetical protein
MSEAVLDRLEPIPDLAEDPVWTLQDVIGAERAAQVEAAGAVRFHAVGDTGGGKYPIDRHTHELHFGDVDSRVVDAQELVARAMNGDLNPSTPGWSPAFFFHLGDVVYFDNTPAGYHEQFYVPYQDYGGKIIAIPGNHDGEVLLGHQASTCLEFMRNFCPPVAMQATATPTVIREMAAQPSVYWWLQTRFVDVIGLYSNCGEGPGAIRGAIPGEHQFTWFKSALSRIATSRAGGHRKSLVVATHHPPITAKLFDPSDVGHSPSDQMSADLDAAFGDSGVWPDAVLSAHVHNYQRFSRAVAGVAHPIPYVVAGGGGRIPQRIAADPGDTIDGVTFMSKHSGHGYLLVTAAVDQLRIAYHPVPDSPDDRDEVVVPLS